jgi:phenylacetic acid degradation operon negative regulatory protein
MSLRTQDLIFTLYGDYIAPRGGEAWIGHLIELMAGLNTSGQAVRSTLSRMTRKGWLRSRREGRHSFYAMTPKAEALLSEGARRIYYPRHDPWDHCWYVLTYSLPEKRRHLRDRLRQRLLWLGFGRLSSATWISPRNLRQEVTQVAEMLGIAQQVDLFKSEYLGLSQDRELVERCWDLPRLNRAYQDFIKRHQPEWERYQDYLTHDSLNPYDAFNRRFLLVHEYRSFPYVDPNLPPELLPADWPGDEAIGLFQTYASMLTPAANQYVDQVMAVEPNG